MVVKLDLIPRIEPKKQEKKSDDKDIVIEDEHLAICPVCGKKTLKIENGCYYCLNEECGYSKCDT